jgi:superfamily II DNA or RNA helicase
MSAITLRDYQDASITGLRANIMRGIKNQILLAPTGAGKTVLGAYLLNEAYNKLKRAIFVCDRISLVSQTSATLDFYGIPHGIMQGNHWRFRPWERIQIASAATLARRDWPKNVDLIIVDECHSQVKDTIEKITKREVITIGLTATPFSKGLGKHYDAMVGVTTTNKLIKDKFLVPFRIFAASEPDMTGAKVVAGEWTENEAADRAMPIVGDCVAEYLKHGEGKKFIAFGCNVAHATELKKQFAEAGVMCELYTYKEGDEFRTETVDEFRKPDSYIRGLISVSALSKGFDVSDVEVIIMARPLKSSLAEHIQILGRGLRIHEGKKDCLILDHAGNCLRFWDAMSEFFESGEIALDMGLKKEAKKQPPKDKTVTKCPVCHHIHQSNACPSCGHVPVKKSGIEHTEGSLSEMGGTAAVSKEVKQDFYSQLLSYAQSKGYASGWVSHKYKEKFGVWPSGMADEPKEPSMSVGKWIRSRQIAFSKAKAKAAT